MTQKTHSTQLLMYSNHLHLFQPQAYNWSLCHAEQILHKIKQYKCTTHVSSKAMVKKDCTSNKFSWTLSFDLLSLIALCLICPGCHLLSSIYTFRFTIGRLLSLVRTADDQEQSQRIWEQKRGQKQQLVVLAVGQAVVLAVVLTVSQ